MNLNLTKYLLIVAACFCLCKHGSAQQGNNWYFGDKAGLTFNTSPPTALTDGALLTGEGCASISDNKGQLLFYTDGVKVYNRTHQVMPNGSGLAGHSSATNSAIVIPKPGSTSIYYIFTTDAVEHNLANGYCYSEVDMTLNGGLGDVTTKNILLSAECSEKLTATIHANGIDVWVITKPLGNNTFKVYRVTCNGVDTIPVISNAGRTYIPFGGDAVGCIKVSPDGKKIATARIVWNAWELFHFDNNTGILTDALYIPINLIGFVYGVEFSPSSELVYIGTECCNSASKIFQYKVDVYDSATIHSSMYKVDSSDYFKPALQLGPDGKIYGTNRMDSSLNVINNPDQYGTACNYVYKAIDLKGKLALRGLPVFFSNAVINQNTDFSFSILPDCKTVNFAATTVFPAPVTFTWDFGDGTTATGQTITHVFPATGNNYNVTLSVVNGSICGASATRLKIISLNRIIPKAKFSFQSQCGNMTVSFKDSSTVVNGILDSWQWDFGDGNVSTLQHPAHTYTTVGNYSVRLITGNTSGCGMYDTSYQTVSVESKPVALFGNTKTCVNQAIQFTDSSAINTGTISSWYWSFGDGTISTLQHPTKTYNTTGDYSIRLVAKSATGCISDTVFKQVQVSSVPVVSFTVSDTCFGKSSLFNGNAIINNGTITKWWWGLGDATVATQQNPLHVYNTPGTYIVKLAATANSGCAADTLSRLITIGSKPMAAFTFITQCGSKQVSFTDKSANADQPVTKWSWLLGDGNTSNTQNPVHAFNSYTNYTVKLVSLSSLGCSSDTVSQVVAVNAKPLADFSFANGCVDAPVQFTNKSNIEAGTITAYQWWLGDGNNSILQQPLHSYAGYGNYIVKLLVHSDKNCPSDTTVKTISAEPKPIVDFIVKDGCVDAVLQLQPNASIAFGSIDKHYWNFGNGATNTTALPGYTYPQFGNYSIQYTAISKNGCVADTASQNVVIESIPVIDFTFNNTCAGKEINFANLSSNAYGNIISWNWNFGNSTGSNIFEPAITYSKFGIYPVSLTASTLNNCSATASKKITISKVTIHAGNDTIAAISQPVQLKVTGATTYTWAPPTYLNNPATDKPISTPQGNITYYVTGITTGGCIGYDTLTIKVFKGPAVYVPNAFNPNGYNKIFRPILAGIQQLDYFSVYNRWGQLLFTTKQPGYGWDGKLNGIAQPTGTYVWMLHAKDYLGKWHTQKGTVVLIR